MNPLPTGSKLAHARTQLLEVVRNPVQLRALITALMVLLGYAGIFMPLDTEITDTKTKLTREQKRLDLARDIEHLRSQLNKFRHCLSDRPDPNEWVQYLLEGTRSFPVNLVTLNMDPVREVGPYKGVVLRMEFEGGFADLNAMLRWLETNPRLCRVDALKMVPHSNDKRLLIMQLTLLGVMG